MLISHYLIFEKTMFYLILIMECFARWPLPRAPVSMIGFMGKNKCDENDDNSDPVLQWSLYVLRDVQYDWFHILYSGNFLSMECNV